MSLTTIAILVFLTIILTFLGVHQLRAGEQQAVLVRMKRIFRGRARDTVERAVDKGDKPVSGRKVLEVTGRLFTSRKITARVNDELAKADIPLKGEEFLALALLASAGGGLFFTVAVNAVIGLLAAVLGWFLPHFTLRMARIARIAKFNSQLNDALVIMANSLRSGFSFLQSMDMVRKELPNPIAKEFGIALQEMNWGVPLEEALANLAERVSSEDLELIITAVLIQRQVGGNLAEVLDNIANTIRERVRIKGEIKTLTAQGRMSGLVVGLLPVFLVFAISFLNPEYIKPLFGTKAGLMMVSFAVLSQLLGLAMIKKIVQIPV